MLELKDIGADNHYFIHGYYFQNFFHMLALCNFLLWVNKNKACIIYNYKLSITPYPIVFQRFQMSFFIYYITLKSIYNFFVPIFFKYPLICSHIYCCSNILLYPRVQYHQGTNHIYFIVWWHGCKWWWWRRQYKHLCWYRRCWCRMCFPFTFTSSPNMMLFLMRFFFYWLWWLHWHSKSFFSSMW